MIHWRVIPLLTAPGSVQMAIDTWLVDQHCQNLHPPTLRFYTWHPATISLGYHQRNFPTRWKGFSWNGAAIEVVRRPTGGRAVLHQGDLTYAVVTSGLGGNRQQSYQQICEFLLQGWRSLGVDLVYGTAGRGYIGNPNCFGTATTADLVVLANGAKFIGSAQLRHKDVILQHGSMRLHQDADLFTALFATDPHLPTLPAWLKTEPLETIAARLTQAAQSCFNASFQVEPLSPTEWSLIEQKQGEFEV